MSRYYYNERYGVLMIEYLCKCKHDIMWHGTRRYNGTCHYDRCKCEIFRQDNLDYLEKLYEKKMQYES